jgi:tetratricopeptide (TPR) repeat protein
VQEEFTMRWLQTEYVLKGIYLGLVLFAALQAAAGTTPLPETLLRADGPIVVGLALALLAGSIVKLREGYRVRGRLMAFILFLLLESPALVYAGILGGALVGVWLIHQPETDHLFLPTLLGGALAGLAFGMLRQVRVRQARTALTLVFAAALVAVGLALLGFISGIAQSYELRDRTAFAVQLLVGIPFFYLLTFAGHQEESEVEIGALCAALGISMVILTYVYELPQVRLLAFFLPAIIYLAYTWRVLPGLRVLKHAFRGLGYARAGQSRKALLAFRRALQLDPSNRLARDGFWDVHRSLDVNHLADDSQTLALVDLNLCLDRAGSLLIQGRPTPDQLAEAQRLLDLVEHLDPAYRPPIDYWRAVAWTHGRQFDAAASALERLLDPAHYGPANPQRQAILLMAWQLALLLHDELRRRVGQPQLEHVGRRMEAIAAVERHLAANPDDKSIWGLKRVLYQDVTEADYDAYTGVGLAAPHFDHPYVQQLGLALIDDTARWGRGGEYLRLAARGLPTLGPTLFVQIARAHQRAGHEPEALHNYELAKRAGMAVGPRNLAEEECQAYFATVKLLGEHAMAVGDLDAAIENFRLYSESDRSGIETLRTLATLYERKGDALGALRVTEQALQYNSKDRDLLDRKDRYYYSVMPEQLQERLEQVRMGFDFDYCLRKARSILDGKNTSDPEWLDVAHHLLRLALVIKPESRSAKVLLARALLRFGEREKAIEVLEAVRTPKPEKFADNDDEEAWFSSCQILGDLYLETGHPDLAIPCLNDFRKSPKSGARTWFKLGQAHEQLGDAAKAVRCYKQVTGYEGNPLSSDAHDAIHRLQTH